MTEQIRKNVFETNSSSSHSLTLAQGDLVAQPFSLDVLRLGTLTLQKNEYGWEYFRYYDADHKADYLFTQLFERDRIPNGDAETVTKELRAKNDKFDMLCRVIETHTGVKVQVKPGTSGYIDHDSVGVGLDLFQSDETLRSFLFSEQSYIETSNDNSGPGKIIRTDRGDEHYYGKFYRTPAAADIQVTLQARSRWDYSELATEAGAVLSEEYNAEIAQALRDQGTVTGVSMDVVGYYHPFEYGEAQGDTMDGLSESGLFFSEDLAVECQFKEISMRDKSSEAYSRSTLTVYVPNALAEQLAALPKTDVVEAAED